MSYTEKIAEKRALAAQQQREQKSQTALDGIATSQDIDELIKQVKEVQLASLLGGNKPTVILTDQTDLGEKIHELTDRLVSTVKSLDSSEVDGKQVNKLVDVANALTDLNGTITNNLKFASRQHDEMLAAIRALKLSTVVNVPEPKVTIKETKIDLKPLQDTIKQYFTPIQETKEKLDLDCYKAQDIDNSVADMQYVGFVNPEGDWYIMENDVQNNRLRYVFGNAGYAEAFANASSYEYNLLNEAVNALSA